MTKIRLGSLSTKLKTDKELWNKDDFINYIAMKWQGKYHASCDFLESSKTVNIIYVYLVKKLRRMKIINEDIILYIDYLFDNYEVLGIRDLISDVRIINFLKKRLEYKAAKKNDEEPETFEKSKIKCGKKFSISDCKDCSQYSDCFERHI